MVHKALMLLRKVPRGMITTYGELARATKTSPRAVGQIMRHNKDIVNFPCYKVVHSDGKVGCYSAKGGAKKKIELLRKDGIDIRDKKIDLKRVYKFS